MKRVAKGNIGYIKYKRIMQTIIVLIFILAGLSLFFICKSVFHSGKNLGTVFAVLLVLPATKALINLILFIPFQPTDVSLPDKMKSVVTDNDRVYYDCVFTSSESLMHLDCICVKGKEIVGYSLSGKNVDKIQKYFTESMKKQCVDVHMHVFCNEKEFLNRLQNLESGEISEEVKEFIRMILV